MQYRILIVTHDLGLAWTVADRVAVMYLGRIVETGPAEEVLLRPAASLHAALLDVVPEAGGIDRPFLTGEPPDPHERPARLPVPPTMPGVASGQAAHRSASRTAAAARTSGWRSFAPGHHAACYLANVDPEAAAGRRQVGGPATSLDLSPLSQSTGISPLRLAPSAEAGPPTMLFLRRLVAVALQDTEDRLHLGVREPLVGMHARRARGREQRPEVGLGHLDAMLQLAGTLGERPRASARPPPASPGSDAPLPATSSAGRGAGRPPGPARPADPPSLGPCPSTRARRAAAAPASSGRLRERRPLRSIVSRSPSATGVVVQETVGAPRRLQSAPRDKRPHCTSDRQWIGEAQFPAKLSWRGFQQFALARCDPRQRRGMH